MTTKDIPATTNRRIIINRVSDIKPQALRWLSKNRLVRDGLNIIASETGMGKSLIRNNIISAVTKENAAILDDKSNHPAGDVILISAEDDLATVEAPRLLAANADTTRIFHIYHTMNSDVETTFDLFSDMALVREAAHKMPELKLIVIDPINAFVSGNVKISADNEIRRVLNPMNDLAQELGICVLIISHLNKDVKSKIQNRIIGSVAYLNLCRTAWTLTRHPDEPDNRRRGVFVELKNNLAPPQHGMDYQIKSIDLPTIKNENGTPCLEWGIEIVKGSADEIVSRGNNDKGSQALEWLKIRVTETPEPSNTIIEDAKKHGFTKSTIWRAKDKLNIKAHKEGFADGGQWMWSLPKKVVDYTITENNEYN